MEPKNNMQHNRIIFIIIQLLTVVFAFSCLSNSLDYYAEQDTKYPDLQSVINNKDLNSYLSTPDSLGLQMIYGWGRDIGKKIPKAGLWIADTLLALAIDNNDHRAIVSAYSLRAQMFQIESDIYNAIKSFKYAIHHGEKYLDYVEHPNFDKLAINYVYLGDLYYDINDIENATKFYKKGWSILKNITSEMIRQQDTINRKYLRAYTTYRWDRAYSKMKIALIFTMNDNQFRNGVEMLKELYHNSKIDDAIINISSGFYLGNALYERQSPDYLRYFEETYSKAKYSKLYNLQSEIGISILKTQSEGNIDVSLATEILDALSYIENSKLKFQIYKILSDYYNSGDIDLSKSYLDSAFRYREIYYDIEHSKYIGKVQSDIEYQTELEKSVMIKEVAIERFYWVLSISVVFVILIIILLYLYYTRKTLLRSLEIKNKLITEQNSKLIDVISSREELIGILAHDLRNPIKSFRMMSSKLRKSSGSIEIESGLSDLEVGAIGLEKQLNSILEYVQSDLYIPTSRNDKIDLEHEIDTIISLNKQSINTKHLIINKDLRLKYIVSNKYIINSGISNVIVNAIKFSYDGGVIDISCYTEDSFAIIKISDYGIGFETADLDRIQKQIKPRVSEGIGSSIGSGFGLITTIKQLEKIGGSLFIESEKGKSTDVMIYLDDC